MKSSFTFSQEELRETETSYKTINNFSLDALENQENISEEELQKINQLFQEVSINSLHGANIQEKLLKLFSFDLFFEAVIQDFKDKMSPQNRLNFKSKFKLLFEKKLKEKIHSLKKSHIDGLKIASISKSADLLIIHLNFRNKKRNYKLGLYSKKEEAHFKIFDMRLNSMSLSGNYRAQFNRIFREEGAKGLIQRTEKKLKLNSKKKWGCSLREFF